MRRKNNSMNSQRKQKIRQLKPRRQKKSQQQIQFQQDIRQLNRLKEHNKLIEEINITIQKRIEDKKTVGFKKLILQRLGDKCIDKYVMVDMLQQKYHIQRQQTLKYNMLLRSIQFSIEKYLRILGQQWIWNDQLYHRRLRQTIERHRYNSVEHNNINNQHEVANSNSNNNEQQQHSNNN